MADSELVFTKKDALQDTRIYQVDDGTIFYHEYSCIPHKLYVKWMKQIVHAKLPPVEIVVIGVHENSLYFQAQKQMFKATFIYEKIKVSLLRHNLEHERKLDDTLCSTVRDGKRFIYRLGENPTKDGILVDIPIEKMSNLHLKDIHRRRLVYVRQVEDDIRPTMTDLSENALVIELSSDPSTTIIISRDASPLIFISAIENGRRLFTLDTNRRKCLRTLKIRLNCEIAGVYNNILTVGDYENGQYYMMTAELPNENFEKKEFYNGTEPNPVESNSEDRTQELMQKLERKEELNEELQRTLTKTVNELLNCQSLVADLTIERDRLKAVNEEIRREKDELRKINEKMEISTAEVFEENKEMKQRNRQLSNALRWSEENAANTEQTLSELTAEVELLRLQSNGQPAASTAGSQAAAAAPPTDQSDYSSDWAQY